MISPPWGQSSARVRRQRLLRALREWQDEDKPVSPSAMVAVKYHLQQAKKCRVALVRMGPGEHQGFTYNPQALPKFIASQLAAQGLTDLSSAGVIVSCIIKFLSKSLCGNLSEQQGYPTLLRWYSEAQHRNYYIFGILRDKMTRRYQSYTVAELLSLRDRPANEPMASMAANPEIADIVRTPGIACKPGDKSTFKKSNSSGSSDEVLFKGNASRRNFRGTTRDSARESVGESSREPIRGPSAVREPVREPTRGPVREPAQPALRESAAMEAPREGTLAQRKYRGRSDSELASAEPTPAPTGIPAQKSEGFQRFVDAVVSPTHVRVTAGGRIVPNTRGHASPASKRSNDVAATADSNGGVGGEKALPVKPSVSPVAPPQITTPAPAPAPMLPQGPMMMPPYLPSYPPGFPTPMPYGPVFAPQMPPGFAFGQNAVGAPPVMQPAAGNTLKDMHNMKPGEARNDNGSSSDKQDKTKLAPPANFAQPRPFFYGSHWYLPPMAYPYPPGMGAPVLPQVANMAPYMPPGFAPGMTPQPIGQFPQPAGQMLQPPGQFPLPPRPAPAGLAPMVNVPTANTPSSNTAPFPAPGQIPSRPTSSNYGAHANTQIGSAAPGQNALVSAQIQSITAAPITSIKPSDITKKQLENFKVALKYHEDQLQFNRHQINEKDMEDEILKLQAHIREFETKLKIQLEHEAKVLGHTEQKSEDAAPASAPEGSGVSPPPPTVVVNHGAAPDVSAHPETGLEERHPHPKLEYGWPLDQSGNFRPPFCNTGYSAPFGNNQSLVAGKDRSWPNDAVSAPAFVPGAGSGTQEILEESQHCKFNGQMGHETGPTAKATGESSVPIRQAPPRTNHSARADGKLEVPYLLGTLPKGKDSRTASDEDYVYSRPLTEEERRARFLYWGNCPKDVLKGLPRYDGRHFYPPSPIRDGANSPDPPSSPPPRRVPTIRHEKDCAVRETKSELDPFRPLTPVQKFVPSKQLIVSEDGWRTGRQVDSPERGGFCYSESSEAWDSALGVSQELGNNASGPCEGSADEAAPDSQEHRVGGSGGAKLWPTMLKKSSISSAVSSTTAQGYLPQFSAHAAASLSPSMMKIVSPIREASPTKTSMVSSDQSDGGILLAPAPESYRENFPPASVSSLEDQFKNISINSSARPAPGPFHL
ncbi:hypothetical protein QBC34DRAFT_423377 [Podospora aff. communis PSN243]|uniref:Uncharacterized protein n=1 Tax=Podospora aff. communis PSN243 TaxID=3040156 RepID=A0AAV9GWI7_9PEZI|nr:hypothetical protein QBC34DRAFT_423377 [Podospora aff. communis PSN243]